MLTPILGYQYINNLAFLLLCSHFSILPAIFFSFFWLVQVNATALFTEVSNAQDFLHKPVNLFFAFLWKWQIFLPFSPPSALLIFNSLEKLILADQVSTSSTLVIQYPTVAMCSFLPSKTICKSHFKPFCTLTLEF